jgi:hypothetical protein
MASTQRRASRGYVCVPRVRAAATPGMGHLSQARDSAKALLHRRGLAGLPAETVETRVRELLYGSGQTLRRRPKSWGATPGPTGAGPQRSPGPDQGPAGTGSGRPR